MSGITLDQITEAEVGSSQSTDFKIEEEVLHDQPEKESRFGEMAGRIMTAETGQGSIGDYLEHPMNFNKSQGLAQILRGLTGIVGNLNLAVIDVVLGALRFSKERKDVITYDVPGRSSLPS